MSLLYGKKNNPNSFIAIQCSPWSVRKRYFNWFLCGFSAQEDRREAEMAAVLLKLSLCFVALILFFAHGKLIFHKYYTD